MLEFCHYALLLLAAGAARLRRRGRRGWARRCRAMFGPLARRGWAASRRGWAAGAARLGCFAARLGRWRGEVGLLRSEVAATGSPKLGRFRGEVGPLSRRGWGRLTAADSLSVMFSINFSPLAGETFLNFWRRSRPTSGGASRPTSGGASRPTSGGASRRNLRRRKPPNLRRRQPLQLQAAQAAQPQAAPAAQPQAAPAAGNLRRRQPPETSGGASRRNFGCASSPNLPNL